MSFSSRRRNYLLTPHRRDGLIEWMKSMLQHSFVLDALETTGADTFSHFEVLIEEHRKQQQQQQQQQQQHNKTTNTATTTSTTHHRSCSELLDQSSWSRLKKLVPTIGEFHTPLPLRAAFELYNRKHKLTKRKHIQISFNEIRHILNLAQIMAMRTTTTTTTTTTAASASATDSDDNDAATGPYNDNYDQSFSSLMNVVVHHPNDLLTTTTITTTQEEPFNGPQMITFDGDQTLYTDGANFESNPRLATYLYLLLKHGVIVAVVTAAGYEYNVEKYEYRLSGLLSFFKNQSLTEQECERFYLFGGECNYLLRLGSDYRLHAVKEDGAGGWCTSTKYLKESPANWTTNDVNNLLDVAEASMTHTLQEMNVRGTIIRKKRAIGLIPQNIQSSIPREVLDETVLRVQQQIDTFFREGITTTPNNNDNDNNDNIKTKTTTTSTTTTTKGVKRNYDGEPLVLSTSVKTIPPPSSLLPYCAFNGGRDAWVDVGNKRVGVQILQSYLGIQHVQTLHIGDQFLNTGNDYAARDVCPCIWITSPEETTYILKSILRLAGVVAPPVTTNRTNTTTTTNTNNTHTSSQPSSSAPKNETTSTEIPPLSEAATAKATATTTKTTTKPTNKATVTDNNNTDSTNTNNNNNENSNRHCSSKDDDSSSSSNDHTNNNTSNNNNNRLSLDFSEIQRRTDAAKRMDVYTGQMVDAGRDTNSGLPSQINK